MNAELIVVRHLSDGIYKSCGGGTANVVSRHASGPRGLINAIRSHRDDCRTAAQRWGNIGCGSGWIEAVPAGGNPGDGIVLHNYFHMDDVPVNASIGWWKLTENRIGKLVNGIV